MLVDEAGRFIETTLRSCMNSTYSNIWYRILFLFTIYAASYISATMAAFLSTVVVLRRQRGLLFAYKKFEISLSRHVLVTSLSTAATVHISLSPPSGFPPLHLSWESCLPSGMMTCFQNIFIVQDLSLQQSTPTSGCNSATILCFTFCSY